MGFHYADCDNNYDHVNLDGQTTRALCILKGDVPDAVFRKQILYKDPVRFSVRAKYYSPWFPSNAIWYSRKYKKVADTYYRNQHWEANKYEIGKKALAKLRRKLARADTTDPDFDEDAHFEKFLKFTKLENAVNHMAAERGDWAYLGVENPEADEENDEDEYDDLGDEDLSDDDLSDEEMGDEDGEDDEREDEEDGTSGSDAGDSDSVVGKVAKNNLAGKLSRAFARGKKMVKGLFKRN